MKTKIAVFGFYLALFFPLSAHAEQIENLTQLIDYLKATMNAMIPLLFGIALIVFIWGVIKYMNADGTAKLAEARNYIIFSILAITIMLSVWGIALMIKNTFFSEIAAPAGSPVGNDTSLSGNSSANNISGPCDNADDCSAGYVCRSGRCSSGY